MPKQERTTKAQAKKAEIAVRREQAIQLRIGGATERQIADRLGVSLSTAHHDLMGFLEELAQRNESKANQVRQLQMLRYERLLITLWPRLAESLSVADLAKLISSITSVLARIDTINGIIPKNPMLVEEMNVTVNEGDDVQETKVLTIADPEKLRGAFEALFESGALPSSPESSTNGASDTQLPEAD